MFCFFRVLKLNDAQSPHGQRHSRFNAQSQERNLPCQGRQESNLPTDVIAESLQQTTASGLYADLDAFF